MFPSLVVPTSSSGPEFRLGTILIIQKKKESFETHTLSLPCLQARYGERNPTHLEVVGGLPLHLTLNVGIRGRGLTSGLGLGMCFFLDRSRSGAWLSSMEAFGLEMVEL